VPLSFGQNEDELPDRAKLSESSILTRVHIICPFFVVNRISFGGRGNRRESYKKAARNSLAASAAAEDKQNRPQSLPVIAPIEGKSNRKKASLLL